MLKYKKSNRLQRPLSTPLRATFICLGILALAAVILAVLETSGTTHFFHKTKAVSGTIPTVSKKPTPAPAAAHATTDNVKASSGVSNGSGAAPTTSTASSAPLMQPSGTFVSNHYPGRNNTPNKEESLCTTTPDAICHIEFKQGSVVKKLSPQTVDASGATTWTWDINQAGLTSGSWQVTAIATLGDQSKTTADPTVLEVQ